MTVAFGESLSHGKTPPHYKVLHKDSKKHAKTAFQVQNGSFIPNIGIIIIQ
jgi:hypothetical protein